jgi:hypothetical protein
MIEIDRERFLQLKQQMGTLPAREQCMREAVCEAIEQAQHLEDVKHILTEIVKQIGFDK